MKSNDPEATLRKGSLPKSSAVETAKEQKGAAVKCAHKQNENDGGPSVAVTPNKYTPAPMCGCNK
jgi:hypothetical protein